MLYPVLALNETFASVSTYGQGYLLDASTMRWFLTLFRGYFQTEKFDPLHLSEQQLRALPRTYLFSAGCDVLTNEAQHFALSLQGDARFSHQAFVHLPHDFVLYSGKINAAKTAVNTLITTINSHPTPTKESL
jgi:acetyl esterase/lipase